MWSSRLTSREIRYNIQTDSHKLSVRIRVFSDVQAEGTDSLYDLTHVLTHCTARHGNMAATPSIPSRPWSPLQPKVLWIPVHHSPG